MPEPANPDSVFHHDPQRPAAGVRLRAFGAALLALAALPPIIVLVLAVRSADSLGPWLGAVLLLEAAYVWAVAWLALRWLVRPLRRLAHAMEQIELGRYRPWMQPQSGPLKELQVLHRGLHSMWEGLEHRREVRDAALQSSNAARSDLADALKQLDLELVQRRHLADELAESERGWRELFEANPTIMWIFDAGTLRFLAVNDAAVVHYGYTREQFLAMDILDILAPNSRGALRDALEQEESAPREGPREPRLWRHRTRDGRMLLVEATRHPIQFRGHAARLCVVTDATTRLAGESRLRTQLDKARSELAEARRHQAADAQVLAGVGRLLAERVMPHLPQQAPALRQTLQRVQRLADAAGAPGEPEPLDLTAMAHEEVDALSAADPDRSVHVEVEQGLACLGEAEWVRLLLHELLENAWKFSGGRDHPWIRVGSILNTGQAPTYFVSDNGVGFEDADDPRLFMPFGRLPTGAGYAGDGLGLALAAAVVRRHGGRIWAQSEAGQGATFCFQLAAHADDADGRVVEVVIDPVVSRL